MRYLVTIALAVALIVAAFRCMAPLPDTDYDEAFLPKASAVQYMALGNNSSVAGLFWIMGLTELGNSYFTGKEYKYLANVAEISTTLDSLFYTPYYFVGSLTPDDSPDTTDYRLMRKSLRIYPEDWRMALGFALRLANGAYPDKKAAADVMRPFLDSPDTTIPPHVRVIHRIFELDTMQTELALETALNDVAQPRFKKFRTSFYGKIYRILGYRALITDQETNEIYQVIKTTIDDLVNEKITFQQAYFYLLKHKKPEEKQETEEAAAPAAPEGEGDPKESAGDSLQVVPADSSGK